MRRPPSTLLRILRSLVALVTVWCTGCSGFEPVMESTFGDGAAVMTCASDSMTSTVTAGGRAASTLTMSSSTTELHVSLAANTPATSQREFSCGCSSCHAVTLASWVVPRLATATPRPVTEPLAALMSVVHSPLLPPPERTAL
jgi:hypothetical protein